MQYVLIYIYSDIVGYNGISSTASINKPKATNLLLPASVLHASFRVSFQVPDLRNAPCPMESCAENDRLLRCAAQRVARERPRVFEEPVVLRTGPDNVVCTTERTTSLCTYS